MTIDKLRGILIDPYQKSITEVHTAPYPVWKELLDCQYIEAVTLHVYPDGQRETLWIDEEFLLNDRANGPFFSVSMHPQPLGGKGIILLTDEQGETRSTRVTVELAEMFVSWRPHVKFTGMKAIEPHEEVHPIFGKMTVVGSTAQFEPIDEEDKS